MSSWINKKVNWSNENEVKTVPKKPINNNKHRTIKKKEFEEQKKRKEDPLKTILLDFQGFDEEEKREELKPEGGSRKTLLRVGDHIESLLDFDPDKVIISTMSEAYIRKIAVVEVNKATDDPSVTGGVNDTQMGVTDGDSCCIRCHQVHCPGHPGKITLPIPIIHRLFYRDIVAILGCVCHNCGHLLRKKEEVEHDKPELKRMSGWSYLSEYSKACKSTPCVEEKCMSKMKKSQGPNPNPIIDLKASKDKNYFTRTDGIIIGPQDIRKTLDAISDEDSKALGFNKSTHPRDLVITVLIVIPPIARPAVHAHGKIKQDQLTHKYCQIVNYSNNIRNSQFDDSEIGKLPDHTSLYECISELISGPKKKRVEFDEFIDIIQRIKSKKGLFRKAIQGKRVNYSARAVLSPSIDIEFGEIGVPEGIARFFHMPIDVTATNIKFVHKLLQAGKIVSHTPHRGDLSGLKTPIIQGDAVTIEEGDEVERMALDGDMVVFNRQPTIHHGSLLGYTVRVITDGSSTIKLHPSSTTTHNADFDGDAAMLLYPRDAKSVKEVRELMHSIKNIIDDKQNRPLAGIIMDGITSAFLMTKSDELVHEFIFGSVLRRMKTPVNILELQTRAGKFGLHPFSGRTLFSSILPPDFNYNHGGLTVYNGILLNGRVSSFHIDTSSRSMVQDIWKRYGDQRAADFITDATWVLIAWLDSYGYSIGPEDIDFGNTEEIRRMKTEFLEDINEQIRDFGNIPSTNFEKEKHEMKVVSVIDRVNIFGGEISKMSMREKVDNTLNMKYNFLNFLEYNFIKIAKMFKIDTNTIEFFTNLDRFIEKVKEKAGNIINLIEYFPEEGQKYPVLPAEVKNNKIKINSLKEKLFEFVLSEIKDMGAFPENKQDLLRYHKIIKSINDVISKFEEQFIEDRKEDRLKKTVFGRQNAIGMMVSDYGSGAKGGVHNISQIGGSVGQQFYAGDRPSPILPGSGIFLPREDATDEELRERESWGRFIPTMPIRPTDREAPVQERGYCVHSFSDGSTPSEVYSQAWGTRGDLINTNMMTAPVGEAQRRLTRALENIRVAHDGSIRALTGPIYQFNWGGDGLESMYMLTSETALSGKVPVFCDVDIIIESINAKHGLIKRKYLKYVEQNKELLKSLEVKYKEEVNRSSISINDRIYGKPAKVIKTPSKLQYGTPIKITSSKFQNVKTPPKTKIIPAEVNVKQSIQTGTIFRPFNETFELKRGDKTVVRGLELETYEEAVERIAHQNENKKIRENEKEQDLKRLIENSLNKVIIENVDDDEDDEDDEEKLTNKNVLFNKIDEKILTKVLDEEVEEEEEEFNEENEESDYE